MPSTRPSTALSRSASSNTTKGDLPPSSSDSFLCESAVALRIARPTSVEPVKAILSTSGCTTNASPVEPSPVTIFTTPGGSPTSLQSSANARAVSGVNSAGFNTTVFALATANTVVLKPAEFTPLTALAFAELCNEVGLPPGVVNIVTGDGSTGEALVVHPDVDKIAFTGSTEVGRAIRRATADSHKKLSLELGGKSPFVVFEDADLDSAVEGLVDGIWLNQGQVCCAGSRLLMQESIAVPITKKLQARMAALRVGAPLDKTTDIGAIVARVQLERIEALVAQGVADGASCWQPDVPIPSRGLYYRPTLFTNVHPTSVVAQQEIFGPVLAAMTFRTPAEAVELANNTAYGLAASVWSESVNVALQVSARIKAGVVWVNSTNMFDAACGFGGYRESGFGREGGSEGLREYLQPVWFRKAPSLRRGASPSRDPAPPGRPPIAPTAELYNRGEQG